LPVTIPCGQTLSQYLDQCHSKRPRVGGRGTRRIRWIVRARIADRVTRETKVVARQFQLVAARHDVGGLYASVHQASRVEVRQRVHGGLEHFARFIFGERPLRNDLRQILFGMLHHGEEKFCAANLATAGLEYAS
jgi:hypothetical protein